MNFPTKVNYLIQNYWEFFTFNCYLKYLYIKPSFSNTRQIDTYGVIRYMPSKLIVVALRLLKHRNINV